MELDKLRSMLDDTARNKADTEQAKESFEERTIREKYKWFEDNADKIIYVQEAFHMFRTKLGDIPKEFADDFRKFDTIKEIQYGNETRIGVQVYWHYRRITFSYDVGDCVIRINGAEDEPFTYSDHCELLDKLRKALEEFPQKLEAVVNKIYEDSFKELQKAQHRTAD